MKKSLILFASLFILGASSISANTIDNVESTTNTLDYQKWIIIVYSGQTGEIIFQETGCHTFETIHERIQEFGGKYNNDDVFFNSIGECD
ncbi:hypothetical protein AV926_02765 [Myroides marinus]|uniref:Beta/Gamma crystallin n=1 Tax=Myroides marinus TaxID=703342 RepID=A0A164ALL2_9FLAO|nr:hypothetical protein [Myroides marinus]KZE84065.1 hypothetical protein AV926_02765 [Myroides marinus]